MRLWMAFSLLALSAGAIACGGLDGAKTPETAVWVERIESADQLLAGRTARGRIGDYKIYNRHVAFVIQDVGLTSGYRRWGGGVADGDVFDEQGQPLGASQLGEVFLGFNQRLFEPQSIELIPAQNESDRAAIHVSGQDAFFEWLGAYLANILPMDTIQSDITITYSLGPDDKALRLDVSLRNRSDQQLILDMAELVTISGDGLKPFFEGPGFEGGEHVGGYEHWLAMGDRLSYGLMAEDGPVRMFLNISNIAFGVFPKQVVPAGRTVEMVRYLAVAEGGLDGVQAILHDIRGGEAVGTVRGAVAAEATAFDSGVRVHVLDEQLESHHTVAAVDPSGSFSLDLPPGRWALVAKADGHDASDVLLVDVLAGQESSANLGLPPATRVLYRVTDENGDLLPARITFLRQDDVSSNILPEAYGEEYYGYGGAARVIWSGQGEGSLWLPDGTYLVVASRGNEYELDEQPLVLTGNDTQLDLLLAKTVDSSGYLAGDFHIHGQFSPDSSVDPDLRVRTAMSEGLDLLVMTEHDTIKDFQSVIAELPGASERIKAIVASEITTYLYGHFNAWPLTEKPEQINRGGIEWFDTPAPDLFARIRQSEDHPLVIQVNHPRATSIGGYFSAVGLDAAQGTYDREDWWSTNFDSIEVFNGGCGNGGGESVRDWFAFLNRGHRISVGGGSDSHYQFHTLGNPRVYVRSDSDPAHFDPAELAPNFTGQEVFVSCGPFVRFDVDGKGLGSLVSSTGPLEAHIQVQAPSWMRFDAVRILRNGEVFWSLDAVDWPAAQGAVRLEQSVSLEVAGDAWFVLEVLGQGSRQPVSGQAPYALTNPIYVDSDANGRFDAPLPPFSLKQ